MEMKERAVVLLAAVFTAVAIFTIGDRGRCFAEEASVDWSGKAEAARMGSGLNWDIDRIRDDIERRAGKIHYTEAPDEAVVALPTRQQLATKTLPGLLELCTIWNPAIRTAAAEEIARRGSGAYQFVAESAVSDRADHRVAAGQAVVGLLGHAQSTSLDSPDWELLVARFPEMLSTITRLFRDEEVLVRQAVVPAYDKVGRLRRRLPPEAKEPMSRFFHAALEQASVETDAHVCQAILVEFSSSWLKLLDEKTRAKLLGKALLQQPFPRGRGSAMRLIAELKPDEIRSILPQILENFRTPCLRDSMFFPGGRTTGFKLITEYADTAPEILGQAIKAASALNGEPWVSFGCRQRKKLRIFWDALADLGPRADSVLPSLEKLQREAEAALAEHGDTTSAKYARAKEAVDYGKSIIARIRK